MIDTLPISDYTGEITWYGGTGEHLCDQGLSTSSFVFVAHFYSSEKPEAACGDFVGSQTSLCLKPFFDVLHARGLAIMLVIEAVVVENILSIVMRPLPGIIDSFNL